MKALAGILLMSLPVPLSAVTPDECAGVVRVFGDASSWMTSAFVVGDGSLVVTTADAVTEKISPKASQGVRTAVFISAYTGDAWQCEVAAKDAELNVALLKLPVAGLPAVQFAKPADFAKAGYGTLGEIMSGDPVGNRWPTRIHGITREKSGESYKLAVGQWTANKAFVTDIGKYKWLFLGDVSENKVPSGSMVMREPILVGMYLNRLVITGGGSDVAYGRCAMSGEIARFLNKHGVSTSVFQDPPKSTIRADSSANKVFQLQALIYTLVGAGRADAAVDQTAELVKLRPQNAQAQSIRGVALTAAGKFEDALKAFDEAAKLNPNLPALKLNRALALIGLKKTSEAEAELLKAVEESPGDVRAVSALADFYLGDEKTYDKAVKFASKVAELAPNSPAALVLLGRAQRQMKRYQESVSSIESALKLAPEWPLAHLALGATCEAAGDTANAEKAYRKLVELQPKNPEALLALATFLADAGKKDEPLELVAKLRELNPPQLVLDAAKAIEEKVRGVKE